MRVDKHSKLKENEPGVTERRREQFEPTQQAFLSLFLEEMSTDII